MHNKQLSCGKWWKRRRKAKLLTCFWLSYVHWKQSFLFQSFCLFVCLICSCLICSTYLLDFNDPMFESIGAKFIQLVCIVYIWVFVIVGVRWVGWGGGLWGCFVCVYVCERESELAILAIKNIQLIVNLNVDVYLWGVIIKYSLFWERKKKVLERLMQLDNEGRKSRHSERT